MRTRANFGVIGNTRTLSTSTVGGMFSIDDQRVAKQGSNWPSLSVSVQYLVEAFGRVSGAGVGLSEAFSRGG